MRLPGWHLPTRWLSGSTSGREVMSSSTPRLLQNETGRQRGSEAGKGVSRAKDSSRRDSMLIDISRRRGGTQGMVQGKAEG